MSVCPCRSLDQEKLNLENCCGPYLSKKKAAPTSEALMRSRYSAYVVKNIDYIDETQVNSATEVFNKEEALKWADSAEWTGLEIKGTQKGQPEDTTGVVEFIAHYKDKASGTELKHHETASFQKKGGAWKFMEGKIHGAPGQTVKRVEPKVGRNDPCSCGSGKKFKKCCGA